MNNDKITKKQEQQLIEMLEIMEDTVEYFCDQRVNLKYAATRDEVGVIAWIAAGVLCAMGK